jgi:hypothetical protein
MSHTIRITVDPPGFRGLNRLARRLNELTDSGRIAPWHLGRRLVGRQDRYAIQFETAADARIAHGHAIRSSPC